MKIVLDGLTNAPLTMQLESALKSAIARGLYKPGDVLPSMQDLASECHTSVRVPRTALARLAADGWIVPRRGIGSVVADRRASNRDTKRVLFYVSSGYYHMKFGFTLSSRLLEAGHDLTIVPRKFRSETMSCRCLASLLKEGPSLVMLCEAGQDVRQMVSASGVPFVLVGCGSLLPPETDVRRASQSS